VTWIVLKIFAAIAVLTFGVFLAGITGMIFPIWPTSIGDGPLAITPSILEDLKSLKAEKKFLPDFASHYPGAPNELVRVEAQLGIDVVIAELIKTLPENPKKSNVLKAFKKGLPLFRNFDSEERDHVLFYLERIMNITGVDGSGELLNVWRYGLPFGWFPNATP
jgi:Domain of unknown function (DUF4844)